MRAALWQAGMILLTVGVGVRAAPTTRPSPPTPRQLRQIAAARAMVRPGGPVSIDAAVRDDRQRTGPFQREYDHYRYTLPPAYVPVAGPVYFYAPLVPIVIRTGHFPGW